MASVITMPPVRAEELAGAAILWTRTATVSAITMVPARARAGAAVTGAAATAVGETVSGESVAGKQQERLCGASRRRSEPSNGIPYAITGFNEDGQALSDALDVKYKNYAQAVEQILHHDSVTALLSGGEVIAITVVGPDGQQSAKLLSGVKTCAAGQGNIDCYSAQPEEADTAHEAGLSCGKYRAFLELQLLDPDVTPEAVQGMTMREIRDMIDRLSSDSGSDSPPSGSWGNGHHGNGGGHGGWRHGRNLGE